MNRFQFAVQVALVVLLVMLVSWPEQRRVRAVSIWRTNAQAFVAGRSGFASDPLGSSGSIGLRSAIAADGSQLRNGVAGSSNNAAYLDRLAFSAGATETGKGYDRQSNAIIGMVRILGTDKVVANARLVLRHIRTGIIEARAVANGAGQFSFFSVDPSEYLVEFVDEQGAVIATSAPLLIANGELKETTLQITAMSVMKTAAVMTPTAPEVLSVAADRGVTRTTSPQQSISPRH
jgi:hypothetical protein